MKVEFDDPNLDRLEAEKAFNAGFPPPVVKGFRKILGCVRAAANRNDLQSMRGLEFKRISGSPNLYSMTISGQHTLVVELRAVNAVEKIGVSRIECDEEENDSE
jgi:plasmid maintenance system killer protein